METRQSLDAVAFLVHIQTYLTCPLVRPMARKPRDTVAKRIWRTEISWWTDALRTRVCRKCMKLKLSKFSQENVAVAPLGRSLRTGSCRILNPEAAATAGRCHNFKQTQWRTGGGRVYRIYSGGYRADTMTRLCRESEGCRTYHWCVAAAATAAA